MSEPINPARPSYYDDLMELMPATSSNLVDVHTENASAKVATSSPDVLRGDPHHVNTSHVAKAPHVNPLVKALNAGNDLLFEPTLPIQHDLDWQGLDHRWKDYCPCNMHGHRCGRRVPCDKTPTCPQIKTRNHCNLTHIMPTCNTARFLDKVICTSLRCDSRRHDHWEERAQLEREYIDHYQYFNRRENSLPRSRNAAKSSFNERPAR